MKDYDNADIPMVEISKNRLAELVSAEAALAAAIDILAQFDYCPPMMEGKGCLGPVDDNCRLCWGKYLMAEGKEAVKRHA